MALDLDAIEAEARRLARAVARTPPESSRHLHRYAWERDMLALVRIARAALRVEQSATAPTNPVDAGLVGPLVDAAALDALRAALEGRDA